MSYTLKDFIRNLTEQLKANMSLIDADMQSDEAIEALNQCLPRNMIIARVPKKEA